MPILTKEELDCTQSLIRKSDSFIANLGRGGIANGPVCEIECEVAGWTGHPDWLAQMADGSLVILDWKTGRGHVADSAENAQLRGYAVAANKIADDLGWPGPDHQMRPVVAAIIQVGEMVVPVEYGPVDLESAANELVGWRYAAEADNAPRMPAEHACKYCPALGTPHCPETRQMSNALVSIDPEDVALMPADKLYVVYQMAKIVERLAEKAKDEVRRRLEAGEAVGDLGFGKPRNTRTISRIEEAFSILLTNGVKQEDCFQCVTFSVPKAEKALGDETVKNLLKPLIELVPQSPPIVYVKG